MGEDVGAGELDRRDELGIWHAAQVENEDLRVEPEGVKRDADPVDDLGR